jgi:hypothetical protein
VTLSHADRSHISADAAARWPTDGLHWSPLLVDGFVGGAWRVRQVRGTATLVIEPLGSLPDPAAVEEEATRLLEFLAPEAGRRMIRLMER